MMASTARMPFFCGISMDEVEKPPLENDEAIEGIIKGDDELVIWISPVAALG